MKKTTFNGHLQLLTLVIPAVLLPLFFASCSNRLNPATAVPAPVGFTATPAARITATFSATPIFSATSTQTSAATQTNTMTHSLTAANTSTFTSTSVFTLTNTPSPTATATATNSLTLTATPVLTNTPTSSSTFTATPTFSATGTATFTATITLVNTLSPTNTPTATSTFTITNTSTNSPTATPTFTATAAATSTVTNTPTPCQLVGDTNVYPYGGIGVLFWDRIQVPVGVTQVTGYTFYLYQPSPVVPWNYEMALYTDNSGSIGTLISSTDTGEITLPISTPSGLQSPSLATPLAVTPGQFYWVAFMSSGGLSINSGVNTANFPFQGSVAYGDLPANGSGATESYTNPINHAVLFCP